MKTRRINLTKRILAALLALTLLLALAACGGKNKDKEDPAEESSVSQPEITPTSQPTTVRVKIATVNDISGKLNIRNEPNTDCEILETALAGDRFEVLTENCQVGWHEIAYKGGKAYISADYVTVAEELQAAPTPTPDPNAMIIVNGSGREEAAEESSGEGMTTESIEDTEDPSRR
ncbi:MAG: SH3 domain-containing protein [Clostridia bacterium]|nr:SH3 domain-containing protein [Clostridia bacterium]